MDISEKENYLVAMGNRIKKCRISRDMTQEELALKCGYKSKSTINKIELGINDIPQSKIKIIADALHTTPAYIMGWDCDLVYSEDDGQWLHPVTKGIREIQKKQQLEEKAKDKEKEEKALHFYEQYESASPQIKAAIDALLKPTE